MMDVTRWRLAKEFGWTLDYIDSLSLGDIDEYHQWDATMDGLRKAHAWLSKHGQRKQ